MPLFLVKLLALPRWAKSLAGIALLVIAFMAWLHFHDRAVIKDHEAELSQAIEAKDTAADEAARAVASEGTKQTENRIDEARKAAAGSDDPLKSALDRMR